MGRAGRGATMNEGPVITFRVAEPNEAAYAWDLYRNTLEPLARAIGGWREEEERDTLVSAFVAGEAEIIEVGGERAGFQHVRRTPQALELWQLFVAPELRGAGLGTRLLSRLKVQAVARATPITLAVLRNNPAKRFYERHGFTVRDESVHHLFLWWRPPLG